MDFDLVSGFPEYLDYWEWQVSGNPEFVEFSKMNVLSV